jgi:hypothetical protein
MMDTVLFTDHDIVVFAITATAAALLLSVLGLATTQQIRSDMKDQFQCDAEQQAAASKVYVRLEADTSRDAKPNEWASIDFRHLFDRSWRSPTGDHNYSYSLCYAR